MFQVVKDLLFVQLERGTVEVQSHGSQASAVVGESRGAFPADSDIAIHFSV